MWILCQTYNMKIFSPIWQLVFLLYQQDLSQSKGFSFWWSLIYLFLFFLMNCAFGIISKDSGQITLSVILDYEDFFLLSSSKSLCFIFRLMICLFLYNMWDLSSLFFVCECLFVQCHFLKRLFFLHWGTHLPLSKSVGCPSVELLLDSFLYFIGQCVYLSTSTSLLITVAIYCGFLMGVMLLPREQKCVLRVWKKYWTLQWLWLCKGPQYITHVQYICWFKISWWGTRRKKMSRRFLREVIVKKRLRNTVV